MKKIFTLICLFIAVLSNLRSQVVLNEIYTSPGNGKNEFFELYNSGTESTALSVDGFSVVTYFEEGSNKGFYVLDLPALSINPRGFFVGSSAMPFSYQGTTNSTASNFSWNSPTLTASSGYLKKWVMTGSDASDGNVAYNEASIPSDLNDLFYDNSGSPDFSIFVFKNGVLINSFYGGVGGSTSQPSFITSMPGLNVNNVIGASSSTFTINFSSFTSNLAEYVTPSVGTNNGFTRSVDGVCNTWLKSSSSTNHTPGSTNGASSSGTGTVTVSGAITRGVSPATTSSVVFDITAGSSTAFPVELQIYTDNGSVAGDLDALDTYISSTIQTSLEDGYSTVNFSPLTANILVVAKTAAGCFGKVKLLTEGSNSTLPVKLVSFNGAIKNNQVVLSWKVDLNETADKFEVERSTSGGKFTSIGTVFGTSTAGTASYGFSDPFPANEKLAYRLRMTDKNQKAEYSKIIYFNASASTEKYISLLQNPVMNKLNVSFQTKEREIVEIRVIDMTGSVKTSQRMNVESGNNVLYIPLPSSLPTGSYVVSVQHSKGMFNQKFLRR